MKKIHIIMFLMIATGIFLLVSASSDLSTYSNFNHAKSSGNIVKIAGELDLSQDIEFNPDIDPNYTKFYLKDPNGSVNEVALMMPKPQDFERAEQVVVTGSMQDDTFVATDVLTKCPSKYKDEEIQIRSRG